MQPFEKIYQKISEQYNIPLEEVFPGEKSLVQYEDWHEGTRYVDGGFDFYVDFEIEFQAVEDTAYYYHTSDEVII